MGSAEGSFVKIRCEGSGQPGLVIPPTRSRPWTGAMCRVCGEVFSFVPRENRDMPAYMPNHERVGTS